MSACLMSLIPGDCNYFQMGNNVSLNLFSLALIFILYRPQNSHAYA